MSNDSKFYSFPQFNLPAPIGSVIAFAGGICGDKTNENHQTPIGAYGWLVCDGSELPCCEYPELYAAIGNLYGGTEFSTFNLPDLRGMFLRGIGPDEASNESRVKAPGGDPNGVGSTQEYALQEHVHVYKSPIEGTLNTGPTGTPVDSSINPKEVTDPPTENIMPGNVKVSKHETRPINTFVYYIIKFKY